MNWIVYIVGLVVIVLVILGFFGLRRSRRRFALPLATGRDVRASATDTVRGIHCLPWVLPRLWGCSPG